jgi:hypothetical protein
MALGFDQDVGQGLPAGNWVRTGVVLKGLITLVFLRVANLRYPGRVVLSDKIRDDDAR